jgi:hypothetical protein
LEANSTVDITSEAESVESIELILRETHAMVKETLDNVGKLQEQNMASTRRAERNSWIRTIVGSLFGFLLGQIVHIKF